MFRSLTALTLVLSLAACGGRTARPVATVSPADTMLTCDAITSTIAQNESQIASLAQEERRAKAGNVAIATVGVLFVPVLLFALDTTNTEQVEMNALRNRNSYLASLSAQRCGDATVARR